MVRRYNNKDRTFRKTYGERYIDMVMNDGNTRSIHQVVDAIITYIENTDGKMSLAYVPHKGKVSHYLSINKKYTVDKCNKGNTYTKIVLCESCDGSGYLKNKPCDECNGDDNDGKDK